MGLINHPTNHISERIIGAAIEVHRNIGAGLLESTYERCLSRELCLRGLSHASQVVLPLEYKGVELEKAYILDLLVEEQIIVEIKAVDKLLSIHEAQLLTYLRLGKKPAGLLINFNVKLLHDGIRRLLC